MKQKKPIPQLTFFGVSDIYAQLDQLKDPLVLIQKSVDFEMLRPDLEKAVGWDDTKRQTGRPRYDVVCMFKMLFLQHLYGLADEQLEFLITDRLSFRRFLQWEAEAAPDATTFWQFRDELIEAECLQALFERVLEMLKDSGYLFNKGIITDATVVEVSIRGETPEQKALVKCGVTPPEWAENPDVASQKDMDAAWGEKRGKQFFGYKNHVVVDALSKVILDFMVTDASVHDSQVPPKLLDERYRGQSLYGDSAYTGAELLALYESLGILVRTNERAYRNHPLNPVQKLMNRAKSTVRARVEHVFGFMENSMNGLFQEVIGIARNSFKIGMTNIVYNLIRFVQLTSGKAEVLKLSI